MRNLAGVKLRKGERVVYRARMHPMTYVAFLSLLLIGMVLRRLSHGAGFLFDSLPFMGAMLLAAGLLLFLVDRFSVLVLTTERIVHKTHFRGDGNVLDGDIGAFHAIEVTQSKLGEEFNYGTLTFVFLGGTETTVEFVYDPHRFVREFKEVKARRDGDGRGSRAPGPSRRATESAS